MSISKSSPVGGSAATIFVVDDEPMLLELAVAILQPLGFDVRTFHDPKKALSEYPAARPALVVTDYAMPGMNGMVLVHECRILSCPSRIKSALSSKPSGRSWMREAGARVLFRGSSSKMR